jgi:hypothetical protein
MSVALRTRGGMKGESAAELNDLDPKTELSRRIVMAKAQKSLLMAPAFQ